MFKKILSLPRKRLVFEKYRESTVIQQQPSLISPPVVRNGLENKSVVELFRGLLVLKVSSYEQFTKNAEKLYAFGTKVLGQNLCQQLLKITFYSQFVAGQQVDELEQVCNELLSQGGIKTMLCPPMEDLNWTSSGDYQQVASKNAAMYIDYLKIADQLNQNQIGNAAVLQLKPSSIFPSLFLDKLSMIIDQSTMSFDNWCYALTELIRENKFDKVLCHLDHETFACLESSVKVYQGIYEKAKKLNVPIVVDGELRSSYTAMHVFNLVFSLLNNKYDQPLLYLTFQMYLKDSAFYLDRCLKFSENNNLCLGLKLVRGAYIVTERLKAKEKGYSDPVFDSYEETSKNYDKNVAKIIEIGNRKPQLIHLFVATHNETSVRQAIKKIEELKMTNNHNIKFAQIYGMCDYISFDISRKGYTVYKSIPWGPVGDWVPYLARRASENFSAFQTNRNEIPHYKSELTKRIFGR